MRDSNAITIRQATPVDAEGLHALIDSIARERRWLLNYEAFWGIEGQRRWLQETELSRGIAMVAENVEGDIIGWADISRSLTPLVSHVGTLGLGIARSYRGQGIGRNLLVAITDEARKAGIEKLELVVRADNYAAIALYESLGWQHEGRSIRAFKHDGEYVDKVEMGLWIGQEI